MYADLVMIVAGLCGTKLEEIVVEKSSELEKKLINQTNQSSYPVLEIDSNTFLFDSFAIAAYIARSSGNDQLLGGNDFEQSQHD